MKKRIFNSMILLTMISLIMVSTALCLVFYRQFSAIIMEDLSNRAGAHIGASSQIAIEALAAVKSSDMRMTVVAPDGTVVFDNAAQAGDMPNHLHRKEIRAALEAGIGKSKRFSDTLHEETVYYAIRLTDGYVLRAAKTTSGIFGIFVGILPVVAGVVLVMSIVGYMAAGRLTRRIVTPINKVNLKSELTAPYDELAPFIRTIEEQRERIAQQFADLQNRSDTISAIMDNMNEGLVLIDDRGIILSANKSVLRIFEKKTPVNGMNIVEFSRDITFTGHIRAAISGRSGEIGVERAGRIYRVYFSHVKGGGAIILYLDTTEKARAEKLRREFSANVSHELKTPLTSIYGNAEMLDGNMVKENDKQSFYVQIKNEAGRLITLVEDILLISRLDESGGQEFFEEIDLSLTAAEAAGSLSRKAAENGVAVRISGESMRMKANRSLIYEMFYNLIDNAIKYNKRGGTADVCLVNMGRNIEIAVSDTGIGIPKEEQDRVFERFYRVDKSRSRKTGGTGLGLAIVKHIVLTHKGKITLNSSENEGTKITIVF